MGRLQRKIYHCAFIWTVSKNNRGKVLILICFYLSCRNENVFRKSEYQKLDNLATCLAVFVTFITSALTMLFFFCFYNKLFFYTAIFFQHTNNFVTLAFLPVFAFALHIILLYFRLAVLSTAKVVICILFLNSLH